MVHHETNSILCEENLVYVHGIMAQTNYLCRIRDLGDRVRFLESHHLTKIRRSHVRDLETWKNELNKFLNHFNNRHPKIKFTLEIKEKQELSFLDVLVYRKENNRLGGTFYRKKTHSLEALTECQIISHPVQFQIVIMTLITQITKTSAHPQSGNSIKYFEIGTSSNRTFRQ